MDTSAFVSIYDTVGHLFRRTGQWVNGIYDKELAPFGITTSQLAFLIGINVQQGLQQRELAEALRFDEATTAGIIRRLEKQGLIERRSSPRSHRGLAIYFTPQGTQVFEQLRPIINDVEERQLFGGLEPAERQQLLFLLSKTMGVANSHWQEPPPHTGSSKP